VEAPEAVTAPVPLPTIRDADSEDSEASSDEEGSEGGEDAGDGEGGGSEDDLDMEDIAAKKRAEGGSRPEI
jgi:hypothetical protein